MVAAFGVVLLGALAQAVSGFGFALVAVPLLALATDARTAVVVAGMTGLGLTLTTAVRERANVRWRTAGLLTGAAALGMPAGLLILTLAPERLLTGLIAIVVLGCTALVWADARLRAGPAIVGVIGVLSGVLTTSTGTNGPPLVAVCHALGYDPRTFRATLAAIFTGTGTIGLIGFWISGQLSANTVRIAALALPAVAIGWWAGNRIFARIDTAAFRRVLLFGLAASSAAALIRVLAV